MKKYLIRIIFIISVFATILAISNTSKASGGLRLKNLNYEVQLNADGTADVTEIWNIKIQDTNTLFKTFRVNASKYKGITDVKVTEQKKDGDVEFTKTDEYKFHVDKNSYYALMHSGKFEIAWGAHAKNVTNTYKISYKIIDAIKNYNDCSEFYWQFIGTDSAIPANYVEGTIKLPYKVKNKEDLKVWAHGPLNGNIEIVSNDTIKFYVENLAENTMVEARIVTPTNIFNTNQNISNQNKLNSILHQEQNWADDANEKREEIKERQTRRIIGIIILNIIGIIFAVVIIIKIIKYHKILKEIPKLKPEQEFEYYRDIPDETETPAGVGFLYYFKNTGLQNNIPKIISATMLDLCMKKYIEFETVPDKKNQIKINLKKDLSEGLSEDEKIIYDLLKEIPKNDEKSFTMKELEKYMSKNSSSMYTLFKKLETKAEEIETEKGNYSKELIKQSNKWVGKGVLYIVLLIISFWKVWTLLIPALIAIIYCFKISSKYNTLTQKGVNEKEKWIKLKRYMEDFSMIKDKTVPELILWEKYLVYATVFGISEKVLKQLKVVYPQMMDSDYVTANEYTYLYLMYSPGFTNSFINSLNSSVSTSYHSTINYSSGSGSGGGFSSGGGFGRRRRPEWEADKIKL